MTKDVTNDTIIRGGMPGNIRCPYTYWINRNLDQSLSEI